ncbi:hypothetical protein KTT_05520 [Tengunoibacter tsumagoiensis]|uniref:Uncharacterized protein n=1 Tax=Tengunoibacter tsumagoiensis TaxID=2014871 RepID=A0A401ZUY1_9CHLR|nr:hypothetical protein KTT_05520 [Tengunoibacter tsumagoiensis]
MNGAQPVQATHLGQAVSTRAKFFWGPLYWFNDNRDLAFTLDIIDGPMGGTSCGPLAYGNDKALFILDTATMQLTQVHVPGDLTQGVSGSPYTGHWMFFFPEDNTHLLAWHSHISYQGESSQGGLYRYDITSQQSTLIIPTDALSGLNHGKNETWLDMRYANNNLFYETVTPQDAEGNGHFVIYQHSVSQPSSPDNQVLDLGAERLCGPNMTPGPRGQFQLPGWDIAPDGKSIVAQMLTGSDMLNPVGKVQLIDLQTHQANNLFTTLSADILNQDVQLFWSPDSKQIVLGQDAYAHGPGIYSLNVTQPDQLQNYHVHAPASAAGPIDVAWYANSQTFALVFNGNVYEFTSGKSEGHIILTNNDFDFTPSSHA